MALEDQDEPVMYYVKLELTGVYVSSDVIVGILRLVYLLALNGNADYTWTAADSSIWSLLEPNLAVVVACGPTLAPVFVALFGHILSRKSTPMQFPSYPSYPERRQQFRNISDSEYSLQPRNQNKHAAKSKHTTDRTAFTRGSSLDETEPGAGINGNAANAV